jgi:hypothetical protein
MKFTVMDCCFQSLMSYFLGEDPMMQSFYVGNLCEPDEFPSFQQESSREFVGFSSPFMDLERNVALFLGLFNHRLYKSLPIGHEEFICAKWTSASNGVLSGGLINDLPLNTMTEEKVSLIFFNLLRILIPK